MSIEEFEKLKLALDENDRRYSELDRELDHIKQERVKILTGEWPQSFRKFFHWALALVVMGILMTGCTVQRDLVDIPGKYHRETLLGTVGGTGANQYGPDGSQVSTYDTTQSFGNGATVASGAILGGIAGSVSKAATASNNAVTTSAAKTAANASIAKASIAAKQTTAGAAIAKGAPINPVTVNVP